MDQGRCPWDTLKGCGDGELWSGLGEGMCLVRP